MSDEDVSYYLNPLAEMFSYDEEYVIDSKLLPILQQHGAQYSKSAHPIAIAVLFGDLEYVKNLVNMGFDIDEKIEPSETHALHIAAKRGDEEMIRYLAEIDINSELGRFGFYNLDNHLGHTPLDLAANKYIADLMEGYGAMTSDDREWIIAVANTGPPINNC